MTFSRARWNIVICCHLHSACLSFIHPLKGKCRHTAWKRFGGGGGGGIWLPAGRGEHANPKCGGGGIVFMLVTFSPHSLHTNHGQIV